MSKVLSAQDDERIWHLRSLAKQVLKALKIPFTNTYLLESIRSSYYRQLVYGQEPAFQAGGEGIVDKDDATNLLIVMLDALGQFHIKNEILNEPAHAEGTCMLMSISGSDDKASYKDTIGFINPSGDHVMFAHASYRLDEIRDRAGHYVQFARSEFSGEPNLTEHRKKERLKKIAVTAGVAIAAVAVLTALYAGITFHTDLYWLPVLGISVLGLIFSYNLLTLESPDAAQGYLAKKFCSGAQNGAGCHKVLSSAASKLFGLISMADIGMVYFCSVICFSLLSLHTNNYHSFLATLFWVAALALPYTFFSLYYQLRVVRSLCRLCLSVQALLWIQFAFFLFISPQLPVLRFDAMTVLAFFITAGIMAGLYYLIMEGKQLQNKAARLSWDDASFKDDLEVFELLMSRQQHMPEPALPPAIALGNADAPVKLTAILSVLCAPCTNMFRSLCKLSDQFGDGLHIQIILRAEPLTAPLVHRILHYAIGDQRQGLKYLSAWYAVTEKNKNIKANGADKIIEQWLRENGDTSAVDERAWQVYQQYEMWARTSTIPFTPLLILEQRIMARQYYDLDMLKRIIEKKVEQLQMAEQEQEQEQD